MPTPKAKYYVYGLLRPNGKVFYIGKGTRARMYSHVCDARNGYKSHKCNIIRKIWRDGGEVTYCTYWAGDDESEAFEQERYWIAFYGVETLSNKTDGGKGFRGYKVTDKQRKNIDKGLARAWKTPERIERRRNITVELWKNPEYRRKAVERMRESQQTEESRNRKRAAAIKRWQDPEFRERQAEIVRKRWQEPEYRETMINVLREQNMKRKKEK